MLEAVEAVPYDRACRATKDAMSALGLRPVERDKDGFQTLFVGVDGRGAAGQSQEVGVRVTRLSSSATQLTFRAAGPDGATLRAIHDAIRRELQDSERSSRVGGTGGAMFAHPLP
jgi:hypothetical protein